MFNNEQVEKIKREYKKGTVIELVSMDDNYVPPSGTRGTVDYVDDIGTIHVNWETGSSLGLVVGEDQFKVIKNMDEDVDAPSVKI